MSRRTGNNLYNFAAVRQAQRTILNNLKERLRPEDQLTLAGALHIIDELLKEIVE